MGCDRIRMVLEINDQVVTERLVEKRPDHVAETKQKWLHTYAIKSRKLPYKIYIEIESNMESTTFKKSKEYIKHYDYESETN